MTVADLRTLQPGDRVWDRYRIATLGTVRGWDDDWVVVDWDRGDSTEHHDHDDALRLGRVLPGWCGTMPEAGLSSADRAVR
jgi:hypothetical protein